MLLNNIKGFKSHLFLPPKAQETKKFPSCGFGFRFFGSRRGRVASGGFGCGLGGAVAVGRTSAAPVAAMPVSSA